MASQALRLGPFIGGLNRGSDPVVVENEELTDCLNLELDIDGSLVSRPAIQVYAQGSSNQNGRFLIFGSVHFEGENYLFGTREGKTFVSSDEGISWSELAPGGVSRECTTMAVYQNAVWLPATINSVGGGMSWTPTGGAVAVNDMPRGTACVVHKNRLYIVPGPDATTNSSRLYFSQAGDFTLWDVSDGGGFIDVKPGDGDTLNAVVVYQDNLLLFKGGSTHILAYDIDPVDAVLKEINPVVGTHTSFGVVQHENTVYCIHHDKVYEIVNYIFSLLNLKVPFEFDNSLPPNTSARYEQNLLTLLGDRLVARFFNRTYVFNIRTRTWSEWRKTDPDSTIEWHIFGPLVRIHEPQSSGADTYYTSYSFDMSDNSGYKLIRILDGRSADRTEGVSNNIMHCIATTKDYDMSDPIRYKKLFWWGADILSGNEIIGSIEPITLIFSPTWEELGELTLGELGTWGRPLNAPLDVISVVDADNVFNTNKLVKFHKSIRFRKANFSVQLVTNGSSLQPTKIFQYIVLIATKQLVSARES
jgi:hypothetical protein